MKKRILLCIFPGLVAFLPTGQKETHRTWPHPEFSLSHNQFAFHLLNAVLQEDPGANNKLVSPLSLYFSLSLLYNGAGHATRDSIAETLQTGDMELPNLNSFCKETIQQMPLLDNNVQITLANSLWYNQRRMTLSPTYESIVGNFFYTQPQPLNFGARDAALHINQWIDQNTSHMIPTVIDHTKPNDGMYLVNALYFKGNWASPFETENTGKGDFYLTKAWTKTVSYMKRAGVIRVFSDTAFTMVELPCGDGKSYSIFALLPENETTGATGLARSLNPTRLNEAIDKMTPQQVELSLPGWESTYSIDDMRAVLSRLGMGIAFSTSGEADFSNMYSTGARKACLSQAKHINCIRVNETGVEAAAASGLGNIALGMETRTRRPRIIHYDHPFLYLLMEKQRNLILMTGIVSDPTLTKAAPPAPAPKPSAIRRLLRKK